jgi:hypothetical protein
MIVVIRCPDFDLHLYLGKSKAPNLPFHVDETAFLNLIRDDTDPERLKAALARTVDEDLWED